MSIECPECEGTGSTEVCTGYRQYGSGYGDCEQTYTTVDCDRCGGSGEVEEEVRNG